VRFPGLRSRFTWSIGAPGSAGRIELPVISTELLMVRAHLISDKPKRPPALSALSNGSAEVNRLFWLQASVANS